MVYYIDLIFFAERLFVLEEMLNLELNEGYDTGIYVYYARLDR